MPSISSTSPLLPTLYSAQIHWIEAEATFLQFLQMPEPKMASAVYIFTFYCTSDSLNCSLAFTISHLCERLWNIFTFAFRAKINVVCCLILRTSKCLNLQIQNIAGVADQRFCVTDTILAEQCRSCGITTILCHRSLYQWHCIGVAATRTTQKKSWYCICRVAAHRFCITDTISLT